MVTTDLRVVDIQARSEAGPQRQLNVPVQKFKDHHRFHWNQEVLLLAILQSTSRRAVQKNKNGRFVFWFLNSRLAPSRPAS